MPGGKTSQHRLPGERRQAGVRGLVSGVVAIKLRRPNIALIESSGVITSIENQLAIAILCAKGLGAGRGINVDPVGITGVIFVLSGIEGNSGANCHTLFIYNTVLPDEVFTRLVVWTVLQIFISDAAAYIQIFTPLGEKFLINQERLDLVFNLVAIAIVKFAIGFRRQYRGI